MRRVTRTVAASEAGRRLDDFLAAWLPEALARPLSRSAVRRLIMAGAVRAGGRPLRRPAYVLAAGQRLEAAVSIERLEPARDVAFEVRRERILYEDDDLIAVDKPAGLSTVPTADPKRPHLVGAVQAYLKSDYVGVHQRLDRETSGAVLFTKERGANPALARAFAEHRIEKTYHALGARPRSLPPAPWSATSAVGGQSAETTFTGLEVLTEAVLVEARPRTGRKHQIRIHLAAAGMPILGDERYGGPAAPRLMLHALALALPHPRDGRTIRIESPYPADFTAVLAHARARG
jgi:23S rRNA pseudouridine1911/1915/1917 synthase